MVNCHKGHTPCTTLPGFLPPDAAKIQVKKFGISGIGKVEDNIKLFMGDTA